MALSNACYANNRIVKLVHPYLESLCRVCKETVHFVEKTGNHIIYLDKIESHEYTYQMYSRIGALNEMYCCATGKSIISHYTDEEISEIWPSFHACARTPHTIYTLDEFLKEIHRVRENGFAYDIEETELGLVSIGTSVMDFSGRPRYGISITSPITRITDSVLEKNISLMMQTAVRISHELGQVEKET